MDKIYWRFSYPLLGSIILYALFFKQALLTKSSLWLIIFFIASPFLAYFSSRFKKNTYHRMVKKFEAMNEQQFLYEGERYSRLSAESREAWLDVDLRRIINKHHLDENEINLWLRECIE